MVGRTILAAAAAAALVSGCGSDGGGSGERDAGPDDADAGGGDPTALDCVRKSGSRIRQVERVHSDDSDELLRLYDSELMVPCSFGPASDGSLRCLPIADGAPFAAGRVFYSDPECNLRIARLDDALGPDAPDFMRQGVATTDGCEVRTAYYTLGNQLAVAAEETVYDGDCVPTAAGTNPYFEITTDLAPAELVEGTVTWTDSGRIRQQQVDAADGSRVCGTALIDGHLDDHPCSLSMADDGEVRCLPAAAAVSDGFGEASCSEVVAYALLDSTCGPANRFTSESTGGDCPRTRVRALLEEVDAIYQMGDLCEAIALEEDQTLFLEGPAVSATSFAAFEPAYVAPGDRLERVDFAGADGLRSGSSQWRDPMLDDAWCTFRAAADGLDRCLPNDTAWSPVAGVTTRYSDAGCTQPVLVGVPDLTCGRPQPKFATQAGENGLLVYGSMGPHPGPLYETPEACTQIADPSVFTQLGAEIPAEMFVSGAEMIE